MEVIGLSKLHRFMEKHAHAGGAAAAWLAEAQAAEWKSASDIRERFGRRVSFTARGNTVFRLGGNKYRLVVRVAFNTQRVIIAWVGTHAEYNRQRF
jgi:mRNA interferase HigB